MVELLVMIAPVLALACHGHYELPWRIWLCSAKTLSRANWPVALVRSGSEVTPPRDAPSWLNLS